MVRSISDHVSVTQRHKKYDVTTYFVIDVNIMTIFRLIFLLEIES